MELLYQLCGKSTQQIRKGSEDPLFLDYSKSTADISKSFTHHDLTVKIYRSVDQLDAALHRDGFDRCGIQDARHVRFKDPRHERGAAVRPVDLVALGVAGEGDAVRP